MLYNTMEKGEGAVAMDVERFSKLGTEHLQHGRLQQAMEAFTDAYKSAQVLGNHGYMQRACAFNLGALLISMGRFNDGLYYLNLAKPDVGCRDGKSNGDLFFNYGLAYEGLKNISESRRYFEMALAEYRSEHSNVKMEADTTRRLGQLCVTSSQFTDAETWMKQLIQAYDSLGDRESRLQAEAERANLLLRMGRVEEAEELADDCLKGAKTMMSPNIGNVFNELGLVYTQMTKYEKALESSQCALSLLQSSGSDPKLVAVLYQNMGALYNYMGRYEDAVEYHTVAVEKHAELKNRKSQGHCFINLGYAYSQLKELEKAGESFLHAAQAAKDCGDKKSEWQSLEAMGSVAYNQEDLKRAQEYYKQALSTLGQSTEAVGKDVQDRLLGKLTHIIQAQAQKSKTASPMMRSFAAMQKSATYTSEQSTKPSTLQTPEDKLETKNQDLSSEIKEGKVIAIRRGSKIKHIRVRRSGTLRQFKKFALGLDVTRPNTAEAKSLPSHEDESILSGETISEHDLEEDDDEEDSDESKEEDEAERRYKTRQPNATPGDDIEQVSDSDESGDDMRKLQAEMKKVASLNEFDGQGTSGFVNKTVNADVHAHAQARESDSEDEDSSESDSSDESDEAEAQIKSKSESRGGVPLPPSLSPQTTGKPTGVRTYETPAQGEPIYETIDHKRPGTSLGQRVSGGTNLGESRESQRRDSDDDGLNFFHAGQLVHSKGVKNSAKRSEQEDKDLETGKNFGGGEGDGTATSASFKDTVYGSIRMQSKPFRQTGGLGMELDAAGTSSNAIKEEEEEEDSLQEMSRAQRDVLMYKEFKKDTESKDPKPEASAESKQGGDQKNSKHCIVM